MRHRFILLVLSLAVAAFGLLRMLEPEGLRAVSWSDDRLAGRAVDDPQSLPYALLRDPASPFRWCELGSALLDNGYADDARTCFERALVLGPNLVSNLSLVARYYTRVGEHVESLKISGRILGLTPGYARDILESYTSSSYRLADTLEYGLPPDPAVARQYLRVLMRIAEPDAVRQAWDWMAARGIPDRELTGQYVAHLVRLRDYDRARAIHLEALGGRRGGYLTRDFVYNGGFEDEPSGSVFDWRISPARDVEIERDAKVARSGGHSLRIDFSGKANIAFRHVFQETLPEPAMYRFRAWVRTEDVSTDKGVAVRVYDADAPARFSFRSEEFRGTRGWTEIAADLAVGPETRRVRIEVVRDPSEKFDNMIRGRAWIDGVALEKR